MKLWALITSVLLSSLICFPAVAAELSYTDTDRATVRVLALGQVDVEVFEHDEVKYPVAIPLAGHGSGVLISSDGLILTAQHVVADSRSVAVMVSGFPKALPAVVVFQNPTSDVALLRVLGTYTHVAKLADASAPLAVRQTVFAIGYPLDARRTDPQSTQGIVSGLLPDGSLQLGMNVNPGNSGGPVVDEEGLVRGIVVARSRVEEGAVGLAYAVPVDRFTGPVNLYQTKPLPSDKQRYLGSNSAQRLASLTQLMSQFGLEVLEASLSGENLEVDASLKQSLDDSSDGIHASVDGRLMSAAMHWNQALVGRARGDSEWQKAQLRAVQLAKQAAALEPALRKDSKFIQIALNLDGHWKEFQTALGPPVDGYSTSGSQLEDKEPPTPSRWERLRPLRWFVGAEFAPTQLFLSWSQEVRGTRSPIKGDTDLYMPSWGARAGLHFGHQLGGTVGVEFQRGSTSFECGDNCGFGRNVEWEQTLVGPFAGLRVSNFYAAGKLLHISASDGEERDDLFQLSGWALGFDVGLVIEFEHIGLGLTGGMYWASGEASRGNSFATVDYTTELFARHLSLSVEGSI
ncbi:MAG: serine protease [Polyangiaceae bacterium]